MLMAHVPAGVHRGTGASRSNINGEVVACGVSGLGRLSICDIATSQPFTKVSDAFPGFVPTYKGPKGAGNANCSPTSAQINCLWAVLAFHEEFENGIFLFHMAAAWLNANFFAAGNVYGAFYPITPAQVRDMFAQTNNGGLYNGWPGWDATFVKNYIESIYDQNAPVLNFCVDKPKK